MKIGVVGCGYVGLTTGVCLAEIGHYVCLVDNNEEKIKILNSDKTPLFEPGLDKLIKKNRRKLKFSTSIKDAIIDQEVVFIAVGTPSNPDGSPDLSYVENVAREIAKYLDGYKVIVEKSTVPVETAFWIKKTIEKYKKNTINFDVVSNPEFLREGCAINDFLKPDRIVIGVESEKAKKIMLKLYKNVKAPKIVVDTKSAELIKHASNSFLAMKISYINAVANICERTGADIEKVALGMGMDKRIGASFLKAGIGYGGSCFPKDVDAFVWIAEKLGYDFSLLKEVKKINQQQRDLFIKKVEENLWILKNKVIGVLGLSFKPNTDDIREAPSLYIIKFLREKDAKVKVYDPKALNKMKEIFDDIGYCNSPYEVAKDADCLLILTEWDEFKKIDLNRVKELMKTPIIIDGRNIYSVEKMRRLGFIYDSVGRKIL
ncbi:MAG: UDP-glucose/GDP-mannose dehydrogenase family protein [Endomicrobia bacterium]|nr:UDP-glucose/GDP-mannose dehydrogenase family protein [Endomicrobiia bacterium]